MGASESKTDGIDVDVDVADAPVDKTPTPINSTLSEADTSADDAKPSTPQAVYRTADAPAADPLAVYRSSPSTRSRRRTRRSSRRQASRQASGPSITRHNLNNYVFSAFALAGLHGCVCPGGPTRRASGTGRGDRDPGGATGASSRGVAGGVGARDAFRAASLISAMRAFF